MRPAKDQLLRAGLMLTIISVMLLIGASCLKDMPESFPERVEWNPEVAFPLGEDNFGLNAVSGFDTSRLKLDTLTGFPDWVGDLEIVMEGTMEFNLASIRNNLEQLDRFLFRVNIHNGFPNEVLGQAYFQDADGNDIDSMFQEGAVLAPPGIVEGDGETIQASHTIKDALFNRERIQPLENAEVIHFQATILVSNPDTALIPYYPSYRYNVRIGALFDLSLEF